MRSFFWRASHSPGSPRANGRRVLLTRRLPPGTNKGRMEFWNAGAVARFSAIRMSHMSLPSLCSESENYAILERHGWRVCRLVDRQCLTMSCLLALRPFGTEAMRAVLVIHVGSAHAISERLPRAQAASSLHRCHSCTNLLVSENQNRESSERARLGMKT